MAPPPAPAPAPAPAPQPQMIPAAASNKHVYGGLVPMKQQQGTRAYTDAASYNQHLAQHQTYTAQQAQAAQASSAYRNPYVTPQDYQQQQQQQQQSPQQQPPPQTSPPSGQYAPQQQQPIQQQPPQHYASGPPPNLATRVVSDQGPNGSMRGAPAYGPQQQQQPSQVPQPPASAYYPASAAAAAARVRSNTNPSLGPAPASVPNQMDVVPPALARLSQMGALEIPGGGGRNALTPVMNRDEGLREWERRGGAGAKPTAFPPALEYLSQQAEMQPASWHQQQHHHGRYAPNTPSGLAYSSNAASQADRDAVMGSVRAAAGLGVGPPAAAYSSAGGGLGSASTRYDPGAHTLYVPSSQYGAPASPGRQQQQYYAAGQQLPQQQRGVYAGQQPGSAAAQAQLGLQQMAPPMGMPPTAATAQGAKRSSQMDWPR